MAGHGRSGAGWLAGLGLMLLALGSVAPAQAQTSQTQVVSIGSRPEFYVPWVPGAPGLTAKPALKRGVSLPPYPAESAKSREQGLTTLEVCVTAEGRLTDLRLKSSSGFLRLDQALLEWAPTAVYNPAVFNGQPFAVCGYPIVFDWRLTR